MTRQEIAQLEEERLLVQAALDLEKTAQERNRLGQFATPGPLAHEVMLASVSHIDLDKLGEPIRFLDPALGTGAFWSALKAMPNHSAAHGVGIEMDRIFADTSRRLWARTGLEVRCEDFTRCAAPSREQDRFDLVVCNPPYVRHHHIAKERKRALRIASARAGGVHISGLAGLYCHFLALAHPWMRRGAIAAWLIPSEFMDVNYGTALKQYLMQAVTLLQVHQFDPNDIQFDDALVSSAVVIFQNELPALNHKVEFTRGASLNAPTTRRQVAVKELRPGDRWTQFSSGMKKQVASSTATRQVQLQDIFAIRRGLVTGGNEFFVLAEQQTKDLQMSREYLTPILPGPRYLPDLEVMARNDGTPELRKRQFLIDCQLNEDAVQKKFPELWSYLRSASDAVRNRYICRNRSPWYRQEKRPAAPLLCTYLGRQRSGRRPFRFILNHSAATAANTYHLLYPLPMLNNAMRADPDLLRQIWHHLNTVDAGDLLRESRVYGGGLHKLEPSELGRISLDGLDSDLLDVLNAITGGGIPEFPVTEIGSTHRLFEAAPPRPNDSHTQSTTAIASTSIRNSGAARACTPINVLAGGGAPSKTALRASFSARPIDGS